MDYSVIGSKQMTAAQLLQLFELRRQGRPDFWIAHVLGFRPSQLVPIGNAGDYEIHVPVEDWKAELAKLTEQT